MEPKELPKDLPPEPQGGGGGLMSRMSGFSRRMFSITKFILGVCLLPIVYAATRGFLLEFHGVEEYLRYDFWWGVAAMLIIYLFIWEPAIVYSKGQKILELIFSFLKPLVRVAPYLLPIYTIIVFLVYLTLAYIFRGLNEPLIFLFGLTITLHLIFSAKTMRGKKEDFLKGNYIFGFSLIYIINLALLSACFSAIFEKFSFVSFCNNSFLTVKEIFGAITKQLFL